LLPGPGLSRRVRRMLGGSGEVAWRRVGSGRSLGGAVRRRLHGRDV